MDSDSPSPRQGNDEPKAEFHKLTNEAAIRKYRRHSPAGGSSDEDGSPRRGGLRGNSKVSENDRRNDDRADDKSFSRHNHDSFKHSSRSYHSRHGDSSRHSNYVDEDDRSFAKSSSRSGREQRGGTHADYRDRESDYNRSRDHCRDVDKYSRDRSDADRKYKDRDLDKTKHDGRHGSRYDDRDRRARGRDDRDEKRDYRSSMGHKSDRRCSYEDSGCQRSDPYSKRESGDMKDLGSSKYSLEGKSRNDGGDRSHSEDPATKRRKFSLEESDARKDERQTSGSKQGEDPVAKVNSEQVSANDSCSAATVDAAKVAAMKAAGMVNQNLVGSGFMTADQKKKLLWGSKKSTTTEESSHHWDTSLFGDRERQEKFKKLMSLRLPWYVWPIVGCEGRCEDGLKTRDQPRRGEAERGSDGFGEAIYCWSPTKRWPHCWVRSVTNLRSVLSLTLTANRLYLELFFMVYLYQNSGNLGSVYLSTCLWKPPLHCFFLFCSFLSFSETVSTF